MINVRGTRGSSTDVDPADPLVLNDDFNPKSRVLPGLVAGVVGLAFYLKSFLTPSVAQASTVPEDNTGTVPDPAETAPKGARHLRSLLGTEDAEAGHKRQDDGHDVPPPRISLPGITGPFDFGVLAPAQGHDLSLSRPMLTANDPLPTLNGDKGARLMPDVGERPESYPVVSVSSDAIKVLPPASDPEKSTNSDDKPQDDGAGSAETAPSPEPNTGEGRNRAPRSAGNVNLGEVGSGATLAIALEHLLSKTTDPDGDHLSATMHSVSSGIITPTASGWRYVADDEEIGEVNLTFAVTDGEEVVMQTAVLSVVENRLEGGNGGDLLVGTRGRDDIDGKDGDDNLAGLEGRDLISGGDGDDNISGGDGNDTLLGGDGNDVIAGGRGDDLIAGGRGDDRLYGEVGDDILYGDEGDDLLDGGEGADLLFGGDGHDVLTGGGDADLLDGGAGTDHLAGGLGSDTLTGGTGIDEVMGEEGDDVVIGDDDAVSDIYGGGAGYDRLDYSAASQGVDIDLTSGTAHGASIGEDAFAGFEQFVGSPEDDVFTASLGHADFTGNGGSDLYHFLPGDTVETETSRHNISDFDWDDIIRIDWSSGSSFLSKAQKLIEDRIDDFFEDFTSEIGADEPRIGYSHNWTDDVWQTLIEIDFDRDHEVDMVVELDGMHAIVLDVVV